MLSVANVRSPSAAASYFASDNYYASADADRSGQWVGEGAKRLGLDGKVEAQAFDALLRGELPDGSNVGNPGQVHRPGTDLKRGKRLRFDPARIRAGKGDQNLALHEPRKLEIHEGDRIRWTRNDHRRGLFNADQARVVAIDGAKVTFETSKGNQVELKKDDPMLKRIDLAYALNAHMAQGLTSDRGIAVMDSRERNLSNQKTFLVTITRLRDHLTLVVDSSDRLGAAVARNKGEKASALEVTAQLTPTEKKNGELDQLKPEEANKAEKELARSKSKTLDFGI